MIDYTIDDEIRCVEREIRMRKAVYPKWIESEKLKREDADREIALMQRVLVRLHNLRKAGAT